MLEATIRGFWDRTQHFRRAYASLVGGEGQWVIHHEHRLLVEAFCRRDRVDAEALLAQKYFVLTPNPEAGYKQLYTFEA